MRESRPPWLTARSIPIGRERAWGTALATIGLGALALGLDDALNVGFIGLVGVVLIFGGVGLLVVAVRPGSQQ